MIMMVPHFNARKGSTPSRNTNCQRTHGTYKFAGQLTVRSPLSTSLSLTNSDLLELRKGSQIHSADELVPDKLHVKTDENDVFQVVAMRMDIQIYEMEQGVYLVDFKCDGYETSGGQVLEEKDVTSPFPFLDMAARLIMQLADAD